jgi:ParB-like chromosome segregation protein Spo0J
MATMLAQELKRKDYVSQLLVCDESKVLADEQLSSTRIQLSPISAILPADTPRLEGEVEEHARILAESAAVLPPIVVHRATMRVVDGMHRLRAAALRGDEYIQVRFVDGTAEDVFVLAVQLNAEHGMPLSRQDRIAAATRIVESHPHWADRRIAAVTGLSPGVVASLRRRADDTVSQLALRTGRDGRNRPVDAAAGRIAASRVIAETPDASLREIASRAGVALATARDVRRRMRLGQDPVPPKLRVAESAYPAYDSGSQEADGPVPGAAPAVSESVLSSMRRDPSLRMSQTGRALLQLLGTHLLTHEQRQDLIAGVPAHRAADVARVARMCADRWLQFASDVEVQSSHGEGRGSREPARAPSLPSGI